VAANAQRSTLNIQRSKVGVERSTLSVGRWTFLFHRLLASVREAVQSLRSSDPLAHWPTDSLTPAGSRRSERAFTMVEIAICLAVIGFALVAIIGVLPSAMNFQRDNREETIIDQDATYWLEAIRDAAKGLDNLTDHVERIGIVFTNGSTASTNYYIPGPGGPAGNQFRDGYDIIGLLTSAALWDLGIQRAEADVYAISGPAVERDPAGRELGMKYRMQVEIALFPWWRMNPDLRPEELAQGPDLTNAILHEVRLQFNWPLRSNERTRSRKVYRSLVQGVVTNQAPVEISFFDR
jgi:hypothetical protein